MRVPPPVEVDEPTPLVLPSVPELEDMPPAVDTLVAPNATDIAPAGEPAVPPEGRPDAEPPVDLEPFLPAEPVTPSATPPDARALAPFTQTLDGTALSFQMVPVPAPPGGRPFYLGTHELTWDLYDVFMFGLDVPEEAGDADTTARPSKPYVSMDRGFGHAGYPVISVSAQAAEAYCAWLSKKTGRAYRLPTADEWRHACALADLADDVDTHVWHRDNARFTTHPAGARPADALGLHDLWGNAMEWVRSGDGTHYAAGGAYRDPADRLACDLLVPFDPDWNASDPQIPKSIWWLADGGFVGFRLACDPAP